jgi:hypothetical protein
MAEYRVWLQEDSCNIFKEIVANKKHTRNGSPKPLYDMYISVGIAF